MQLRSPLSPGVQNVPSAQLEQEASRGRRREPGGEQEWGAGLHPGGGGGGQEEPYTAPRLPPHSPRHAGGNYGRLDNNYFP